MSCYRINETRYSKVRSHQVISQKNFRHKPISMSTRWCFGLIGVKEPSNPSQKEEIASYKKRKANKVVFLEMSTLEIRRKLQRKSSVKVLETLEAITVMEQEQAKHVIAVTIEEATIPYYEASEMEEYAAIRIQTAFRAYLARRAFRALKGLVRLQALFRGHRVRKQADITIKCMLSLVRVQAQIRAYRARMSKEYQVGEHHFTCKHVQQEPSPRKSMVVARQVAGPWRATRPGVISPVTGTAKVEPKDSPGEWSSQGNTQILEIHPTQQRIPKKLSEWCEKMSVETQTCSDSTEKSVQTAKVIQSILPSRDRWAAEARSIMELSTREDKHDLATMKSNHKHFNTTGSKSAFKSESGKVNQQLNEMEAELGFRSYMSPTQSAKAKVRCRSVPKLRPSSSDKSSNYTVKRLSVSSPDKAIYPAITRPSGGFS